MTMQKLPHELERLEPELQSWLEKQLLEDLTHYRITRSDLRFDWSNVTQEGHWTDYRGRMVESLSDISIFDSHGSLVAEGWMDFIYTSGELDSEPKLFWLFLSVVSDGNLKKVKKDAFLPLHLWDSLTETQRQFVADSDSKWLERDPKIQEWKQRIEKS